MGSHGANGFKEMFIGSNAEKVVRSSDVPVLVIKNDHDDFQLMILCLLLILKMTIKKHINKQQIC